MEFADWKIIYHACKLSWQNDKCSFLALSTLLETLYVFGLDAVEKTIKTEKNVNELSGPGEVTQVRVVVRATAWEKFCPSRALARDWQMFCWAMARTDNPLIILAKKSSEITQNDHAITSDSKLFHVYDFNSNLKINRLISGICRLKNYLSCLQIELTER